MYYEINVAHNGRHLFATHERSVRDEKVARELTKTFREKFPELEGYSVTCTKWVTRGETQDF